jgi:hypothetical protein
MTYQQRLGKRSSQHWGEIDLLHRMREELGIEKCWDFGDEIVRLKQAEMEKEGQANRRTLNNTNNNGKKKKKKNELSKLEKLIKLEKQCDKSGLVAHHVKFGHRINFQDIKVIDRDSNRSKLETIETLHIKTTSNNINKKDDLNRIKNCYDGILCKIRKIKDKKLMPDRKL